VGCFGDLFCGKLSPFCQKNKLIILLQFPVFKKKPPITEKKEKRIAKKHHN
jgi:hypothetical protein